MKMQIYNQFSNIRTCFLFFAISLFMFSSCGESKKEQELREKKQQKEIFNSQSAKIRADIADIENAIEILEDKLQQYNYDLNDAYRALNKANEFQLLRTSEQKAADIVAAQRTIDKVRAKIDNSTATKQKLKRKLKTKQQELDALVAQYGE